MNFPVDHVSSSLAEALFVFCQAMKLLYFPKFNNPGLSVERWNIYVSETSVRPPKLVSAERFTPKTFLCSNETVRCVSDEHVARVYLFSTRSYT